MPPPIRSRIKPESFILKATAYRISSNIGREITGKNLQAAAKNFRKKKTFFLYCVDFSDEELQFFEINFETPCIFRGIFELG